MTLTREGKRFVLATFLIAVSAFNTGNNLIFLILSLMLAFVALSGIVLKINITGLSLDVSADVPLFAGSESLLRLDIANTKRRFPSYSVTVTAPFASAPVSVPVIPAASSAAGHMKALFAERGLYRYGSFEIRSGFPFILFSGRRDAEVVGEVLVYPRLVDVSDLLSRPSGDDLLQTVKGLGLGDDLFSLREFHYGDDRRRVHWKASAKASSLLVKEYAVYEGRRVTLVLDNLSSGDDESFEKAVTLAASLAGHFLGLGYFVRMISCRKVIPFGAGDEHFFTILDVLAVVGREGAWESPVPSGAGEFLVCVFMSVGSSLRSLISGCDMVVYAEDL